MIGLPGTRLAAENWRDIPRLTAAAVSLLGPKAGRVIYSGAENSRCRESEWSRTAINWLQTQLVVEGMDHIDPDQQYVLAPLHEGFADAIALLQLPLSLRFVARRELTDWRVLGRALSSGRHPMVTPETGAAAYRTMLREAPSILEGGESLVVFPQGSILGIEAAFSAGAFRLAAAMGVPLLPVVLTGSHRVWEHPFSPLVRFGQRIHMEILAPVPPDLAADSQRTVERAMKQRALNADPQPRRYVPERDGWWDGYHFTIDPDFPELAARVADHRRRSDRLVTLSS